MVGFAVCCNGQTRVDTVDWSADTDWGYSNKLASENKQQLMRFTTCKVIEGKHLNAKPLT